MKKLWLGAPFAVAVLLCMRPAAAQIGVVSVTGGRVEGVTTDGVTSFKGIPFAAPPVGNLRWRAPQPVRPWSGIKKADHFGPSCMQDPKTLKQHGLPLGTSEDCLYLNVWTAARSARERLPVMVWIYGGGFVGGTANDPVYDGTHLARKGVILVSVAYRVGALGFLADPELSAESPHHVSGNYGLRDMIAALEWVRANIRRFGGDPSRVTIFGQSAGGIAVSILAVSPAAKGLFQRAISESGGSAFAPATRGGTSYASWGMSAGLPFPSLASWEVIGQRFLAKFGARDIAAARALTAGVIEKAFDSDSSFVLYTGPVFDGDIFPNDGYDLFQAGRFNDTPILVGTNANEEGFPDFRAEFAGTTPKKFEANVRAAFGPYANQVLAVYPHATNAQAQQASEDLFFRDAEFAWPTWAWARLQSERGHGKAYLYYFDRAPSPDLPLGPIHGAELGYVFDNAVAPLLHFRPGPREQKLVSLIQSYWVNFAKTGDPNGPRLPYWPAFSASSQRVMYLDTHPRAGPVPNLKKLKALDAYFAWLREEAKKKQAN